METGTKECVACAEAIRENAKICRFCNTMQDDARFVKVAPAPQTTIKAGKLESTKLLTVCTSCGESNSKTLKRCRRCDAFLDHSNGEYVLTEEEAQFHQNAAQANTYLGPTPGIAIAAIVCAFLVPILGLVLGYAARNEVRNATSPKNGDGLATAAIVIGWVWLVIAIFWGIAIGVAASQVSYSGY